MMNLLLEVLTFGFHDPMRTRMKEAEEEIDRLKDEAHRMADLRETRSPADDVAR